MQTASRARGVSSVEYMIILGLVALVSLVAYAQFGKETQDLAGREGECVRTFQCADGTPSGGMPSGKGVANDPPPSKGDPTQNAIERGREITGGKTWQSASRAEQDAYVKYVQGLDEATARAVFEDNAKRRGQEVDQGVVDAVVNVAKNSKVKVNVDVFGMRGEVSAGLGGFDYTGKTVPVTLLGGSAFGMKGELQAEAGFGTDGGGAIALTAKGSIPGFEAGVELGADEKGARVKPYAQVGRDVSIARLALLGLGIGASFEVGSAFELPR
jgi:hypothetical protein